MKNGFQTLQNSIKNYVQYVKWAMKIRKIQQKFIFIFSTSTEKMV